MNISPYFWFSSFYQYWYMKYQFGPFWSIFVLMTSLRGRAKFRNSEIVFSKMKTSPQFFRYYWLSSFYHHWYMKYKSGPFLTQFSVNDVTMGVRTVILWENDLCNKLFTSMFHKTMIPIFLSVLIHVIQLWALFTQFGDSDVTKE